MIIYQSTKRDFVQVCQTGDIDQLIARHYSHATGHRVGEAEFRAWGNSLTEMARVLADEEIPADSTVAIEYQLPQNAKRIDLLIAGEDDAGSARVVIVELKQWSSSSRSSKDAIILARRGGPTGEREGVHPSYQAWSYAAYLHDFNAAVEDVPVGLRPCAYLHNHPRDGEIDHPHYAEHLARAPLFLKDERAKLQAFIRQHVRRGDRHKALYAIEHGRIRPSKLLIECVTGLLQGKTEFILIDDQKLVYESILDVQGRAGEGARRVVIVQGGPGTGKSVVAMNLLGTLIGRQQNVRYVSKNAAPRAVFEAKLTGSFKKSRISNLFSGSGAFVDTAPDSYDALIVDEAHRLNEKSGLYGNQGDHQVRELIRASRCTVFFVDDDQRVTLRDIGTSDELRRHAAEAGATVTELSLSSQFRCNGSDGYLAFLHNLLQIRPTANDTLDAAEFDFRVFDDPAEMHDLIIAKNRGTNRSRVVAGYCWKWPSKKDPKAWDIDLPAFGYRRQWNLDKDSSLWIVTPGSEDQVGCIHTSQGLELDYVGVIIGPDMRFEDGVIVTDATRRASSDQSIKGLKAMLKTEPERARALADAIVKNTYRTLMTRGMKGCFVYCTDQALAEHFRSRIIGAKDDLDPMAGFPGGEPAGVRVPDNVVPLRRVPVEEVRAGARAIPVIPLRFAAGGFSEGQSWEDGVEDWVEPPDWVQVEQGLFVAQVIGESMNRRIPNGAWCLFRLDPQGTRQGKIVVVQHRDISDAETGGGYTIKRYGSRKAEDGDGGWRHEEIVLRPETTAEGFEPIVLRVGEGSEGVRVVAEFLVVVERAG